MDRNCRVCGANSADSLLMCKRCTLPEELLNELQEEMKKKSFDERILTDNQTEIGGYYE